MKLPEEKLQRLKVLIAQWIEKKAAKKKSMLSQWASSHVLVWSDNIRSWRRGPTGVMHLLLRLHFFCARHNIRISPPLPGIENNMADTLSRNNLLSTGTPTPNASPSTAVGSSSGAASGLALSRLEVQAEQRDSTINQQGLLHSSAHLHRVLHSPRPYTSPCYRVHTHSLCDWPECTLLI